MSLILSIDTSTKVCSVAIHQSGELVGHMAYHLQKSHSSLLPEIIHQLVDNCELALKDLAAVAISEGPGSYTGLRIGTASAKGLAFAMKLPLIAVSSLDSMIAQTDLQNNAGALFCPMIDARRMEVYCKLVDSDSKEIWDVRPVVIDRHTFDVFGGSKIFLFGNGSDKLMDLFTESRYRFIPNIYPGAAFMGQRAYQKFVTSDFVDLAYFEPEYLKEYQTNVPSQKFRV